jgi:hypothetical protein
MTAHSYALTCHFSLYALDPDTPESDYEIHLIKTHDPAYIPPDNEAWPLYYQVIVDALEAFPEAHKSVRRAVTVFVEKIKGRRALLPRAPHSARHPNEPNPLPRLPDLGSRT